MSFEDMNFWQKRAVSDRMRGHRELANPIMNSYDPSPGEDLQKMVFENYPSTYPSMKGDNREYYCVFI